VSARYEICAASSEDCVCVPPNLYDVIARRSVRKQRRSNGNSGIYSRGISTAGVWLGWYRYSVSPGSGSAGCWRSSFWLLDALTRLPLDPESRDARIGCLCLLADALPRGRLLRLRAAESSALWA